MKNYSIEIIDKDTAKHLIIKNHYSHTWTSCRYAIGLFDNDVNTNNYFTSPELVGVAVLGFPVGRQTVKSITENLNNDEVLELTRLWLKDEEPKNSESYFLGKVFDWLRKNTKVKFLISYSDPEQNHVGTIYQATNAIYQGDKTRIIDAFWYKFPDKDEWIHPRTVVSKYGTIKENELLRIFPAGYKMKELKRKHRYIWIFGNKKEKKKLLLKLKHPPLPYPKKIEDFVENIIDILPKMN